MTAFNTLAAQSSSSGLTTKTLKPCVFPSSNTPLRNHLHADQCQKPVDTSRGNERSDNVKVHGGVYRHSRCRQLGRRGVAAKAKCGKAGAANLCKSKHCNLTGAIVELVLVCLDAMVRLATDEQVLAKCQFHKVLRMHGKSECHQCRKICASVFTEPTLFGGITHSSFVLVSFLKRMPSHKPPYQSY